MSTYVVWQTEAVKINMQFPGFFRHKPQQALYPSVQEPNCDLDCFWLGLAGPGLQRGS